MSIFIEDFSTGLTNYTLVSGNLGLFTIVTDTYTALNIAAQASPTVSKIRRTFTGIAAAKLVRWNCKVTAENTDDGATILISNTGSTTGRVAFVPARESAYDSQRRPRLYMGPTEYIAKATKMTVGVWYECKILTTGSNWTFTMTDLSTNTVVSTVNGTMALATMNYLEFSVDSGLLTSPARYSDIVVSSNPLSVSMSPIGVFQQFFTDTGAVVANGKINTYAVGTSTPLATYTSVTTVTENTNPIILDTYGRVQTNIFLDDSKGYNFVVTDSSNNIVTQLDNVRGINTTL